MNTTTKIVCMAPFDLYNKQKIYEGIKNCDYLMSDEKCVKRLFGIKWQSNYRDGPFVTVVCSRSQMAYAKQVAYALGKRIVPSSKNSVRILKALTE